MIYCMVKLSYMYIYVVVDAASTVVVIFVSGFVFDLKTKRRIFSFLDKKG